MPFLAAQREAVFRVTLQNDDTLATEILLFINTA